MIVTARAVFALSCLASTALLWAALSQADLSTLILGGLI